LGAFKKKGEEDSNLAKKRGTEPKGRSKRNSTRREKETDYYSGGQG